MVFQTRERLLRVNSLYRQVPAQSSNSNFQYLFDNRYSDRVRSINLQSASIPRLFPNVYAPLNVLHYLVGAVETTLVIPEGQYTATELAVILNNSTDFDVTYDATLQRFLWSWDAAAFDVTLLSSSPIADLIGLSADLILTPVSLNVPLASPPQMAGPCEIYLESDFLGSTRCLDTPDLSKYIPLITVIDCSPVPYGFCVNYSQHERRVGHIDFDDSVSLRFIDFKLTDQRGFVLPLPSNGYIDLVFEITYVVD